MKELRFGSMQGALANPNYNTDGTLASSDIDGISHVFTYSNGKIETVIASGVTKTYTWVGNQLQSVVIS